MRRRKTNKKPLIITLAIASILIIVLISVFMKKGERPINVTVSTVEARTITQTVSSIGKIQPETEVKISSQTSGEVMFLGVKEGDTVKMRQLLARINPDIVETQLEQVRASAEAAKMDIEARKSDKERAQNDYNRAKELVEKKFISQQEFEMSRSAYEMSLSAYRAALSRYDQAKATLRQFERSIARTAIFSPINGIVTSLSVELGEKVVGTEMMMGTEMMRVSDLSVMNAVVDVDENDIVLVKIGDKAIIEIDAIPDRQYQGEIIEIGHSAKVNALGTQDQVTNFAVKVRLIEHEPRLRPGMSCNVEIKTDTRENVLAVPLQSVTIRETKKDDDENRNIDNQQNAQKSKAPPSVVFIKDGDVAKMVQVETGIADRGFIEITSGLKKDETVISGSFQAVSKLLSDGAKIAVDTLNRAAFKKK